MVDDECSERYECYQEEQHGQRHNGEEDVGSLETLHTAIEEPRLYNGTSIYECAHYYTSRRMHNKWH